MEPIFVVGAVLSGILVTVFVVVVISILILKLMPDSIEALYIHDFAESIQEKLGLALMVSV